MGGWIEWIDDAPIGPRGAVVKSSTMRGWIDGAPIGPRGAVVKSTAIQSSDLVEQQAPDVTEAKRAEYIEALVYKQLLTSVKWLMGSGKRLGDILPQDLLNRVECILVAEAQVVKKKVFEMGMKDERLTIAMGKWRKTIEATILAASLLQNLRYPKLSPALKSPGSRERWRSLLRSSLKHIQKENPLFVKKLIFDFVWQQPQNSIDVPGTDWWQNPGYVHPKSMRGCDRSFHGFHEVQYLLKTLEILEDKSTKRVDGYSETSSVRSSRMLPRKSIRRRHEDTSEHLAQGRVTEDERSIAPASVVPTSVLVPIIASLNPPGLYGLDKSTGGLDKSTGDDAESLLY